MTHPIAKLLHAAVFSTIAAIAAVADVSAVKEQTIDGPHSIAIKVRMEGPYTADVPLQVVCYFKYTEDGAKRMGGAPVELDKRLGGAINSLRTRGEFQGDELETLLIRPKEGAIKAKALLLIGLGDESRLSLDTMERVGRTALREARALGASKVAFAPLIRDQGNTTLGTGLVETAVVRGVLLAYETERQMQAESLSKDYTLAEWWVEAGPAYFDETVSGVRAAVTQAQAATAKRPSTKYAAGDK
jgi:Cytosol aminopeptidase family, N-terminal domain